MEAKRIINLGINLKMELGILKIYNYYENMDVRNFNICGIFCNGVGRAINL